MKDTVTTPSVRVRTLLIYHHAFLRDLVTKILSTDGVEIIAAVKPEDLSALLLGTLRPEVIVVDQAAMESIDVVSSISLLGPDAESASRIILVGLSDANMLVWRRQVVTDADVAKLVGAVVGEERAELSASSDLP